jgi:hypothetical protein
VKSYYWSRLHCDERDANTVEHVIIMGLLVGVLWAVTAVSSMRIGHDRARLDLDGPSLSRLIGCCRW